LKKNSEPKNCEFWVFEKRIRIKEPLVASKNYFPKKFKEPPGFMKDPTKDPRGCLKGDSLTCEIHGYIQ
jgi:hypothetical protein